MAGLLAAHVLLVACASPSWYAQAVGGHYRLMSDRQDIEAMLTDEATDPELARKLELALEIRSFAVAELGLPDNGSYLQFTRTGREAVTWNVLAAPEFSLAPKKWCFAFSGCVPYRGYFDDDDAHRFANKLAAKGYDVTVAPAAAYSTLGWFDDPLVDTMLKNSEEGLAAFLFHELAHQQLYLRGDTAFSEAYASFVEEAGVRRWLEQTGRGDRLPAWDERREAGEAFNDLLLETRRELAELYAAGKSEDEMRTVKAARFDDMKARWIALASQRWPGRNGFAAWFDRPLNNARLALATSYRGGVCSFASLYREAGGDMAAFHERARAKSRLDPEQRAGWLSQPCQVIAENDDL